MSSYLVQPVAVCGMALRLPGNVDSVEKLWNALRLGQDMRSPVPTSRYSTDGFGDQLGEKGAIKTKFGYFLEEDISCFDASMFSLTEEEVKRTDPQQRLLLEVVKECFENAGETNYRGSDIGCYVGTFGDDWSQSQSKEDQHSGGYIMSGQVDLFLANRISYENNLRGPSMVIKTGCSASLTALHEACRALQMHDCDGAIVAGSNLILGPYLSAAMTSEGILSPEGSCKTFDGEADGFARGEAVTAVYLRLLSRAVQENMPVRAVIANSGVNCDGRSQSLLQPSAEAQIALMRKVHGDIGSDPAKTAFVEMHGTGTSTGDPIEATAVGHVFGKEGVYIGSIKPNLGHSEGASGLSSLLKSIIMLEKSMIIPNIKFNSPNPKIPFKKFKLRVPQELLQWPKDRDMRVAINSFGIGGSNVHVIVEHPYRYLLTAARKHVLRSDSPQLLLMSASTSTSLRALCQNYKMYMEDHPDSTQHLAYTLAQHREHHQHRTFAISTRDQTKVIPASRTPATIAGLTMIFSGQGTQWAQMGQDLLNDNAHFLQAIIAMDKILCELQQPPAWTIETELRKPVETSQVNRAELSQPLCTAVQVALLSVFRACGVQPSTVIGHSSGEIAAAYASGAISMKDAITIAYYRGFITKDQTALGSMAAIGLDLQTTSKYLRPGVVIACENSPSSTTISGDKDMLQSVLKEIRIHNAGVLVRELNVEMAYHSHHMKSLATAYSSLLQDELSSRSLCHRKLQVPMFSSMTDQKIVSADDLSIEYWVDNLVHPVRFNTAMASVLRDHGNNLLLEVGPHSSLAGPLREICSSMGASYNYCPTLIRSSNSTQSILTTFGTLYQRGIAVKWDSLIEEGQVLTDLPVYPWDHSSSYWYESRVATSWRLRRLSHHELLGLRVPQSTDFDPIWRVMLNVEDVSWLADHKVEKDIVFPFAAYVAMAGEAFRQVSGVEEGYSIRSITVSTAMLLDQERPLEVVTSLHTADNIVGGDLHDMFVFTIASYTGSTWVQHCRGMVASPRGHDFLQASIMRLPRKICPKNWYGEMARLGLVYGETFRKIESLSTSTKQTLSAAQLSGPSSLEQSRYLLHPTTIDSSFQVGLAALTKGICRIFQEPQVPVSINALEVSRGTGKLRCTASGPTSDSDLSIDVAQLDGKPCLTLRGMKLKPLLEGVSASQRAAYGAAHLEWVEDYDFLEASSLIKVPNSKNRDKHIIEELALLCIVESLPLLKGMTPHQPHLLKYRTWLERVANDASHDDHPILNNTASLMSLVPVERQKKISELCQEASASPLVASFVEGILRIRDNIQGIFSGKVDTLELLLREDNLARIYDAINFDYSDFICTLSDTVPSLRILEIGAGTGATTEIILRGLQSVGQFPPYSKYTFTDISAGFFPKARESFAEASNMDFKVFDISQDPFKQGFEPESYDLILAANVIHATPNLTETLLNIQPLLSSGGQLVLTEFCTGFRAPNYIYGNFSGWWLGEADDREWEPYVNVARWDKELKATGFSGASDVVLDSEEPWQYCATIVARKAEEKFTLSDKISILCKDSQASFNQCLLASLNQGGYFASFVTLQEYSNQEQDQNLIVSLDLEASFFEDISEEKFVLFQVLCRNLESKNVLWLMPPTQIDCANPRGSQSLGMIRTVRSELDISIMTLEIDPDVSDFAKIVLYVFRKVRRSKDCGSLAPDWEFAVHDSLVKVGRYRPFDVHDFVSLRESASIDPEASYMITGGLGGLGRAIAVWLAERGARNLLFLSPSAGLKLKDQDLLTELEDMGCAAIAIQGMVQSETDVSTAIRAAKVPIKGVLHLAMQLRDASVVNMTYDEWRTVLTPKVEGTWNLHNSLGGSLDFFIMTSSLSTIFSQPGQSNYNAANTFMEAFCQYRHTLGLPATVLNVCPIEGIGYVAENTDARRKLKSQGHWFLDERALLEFLELAILYSNRIGCDNGRPSRGKPWVNESHIVMGLLSELPLDDPSNRAIWRRDRRMGLYHNVSTVKKVDRLSGGLELMNFLARVKDLPDLLSEKSSKDFLAGEIGKRIFNFIMRSEEDMDLSLSLAQVGLDSLMAIELRRWWKQALGGEVSILEIVASGTIAELGEVAATGLRKRLNQYE